MPAIISIKTGDEEISLKTDRSDFAAAVVRAFTGVAPLFGPFIAEILTIAIPQQKMDRVVAFVKLLDDKLSYVQDDLVKLRIKSEEFADLLEDALSQASRSLSDERKSQIASLLKNSVSRDELKHLEHKKLLGLLNELNDVEILWLKHYSLYPEEQSAFWEQHGEALGRFAVDGGQAEIDEEALLESYTANLQRLGLIDAKFSRVEKDKLPDFDEKTGMLRASYVETSKLGRLLLRYMDLSSELEHTD